MYLPLKQVSPRLPNAYRRSPWGTAPTPSQKRLPLTIHYFLLEIGIFTTKIGKHNGYHGKHHAYQEAQHWPNPPTKNAYRLRNLRNTINDALPPPTPSKTLSPLQYSICAAYDGKHHALHEVVLPPPSQKRLSLTIQYFRLKIDIFTSKTGKHKAYQMLTDAYHEAVG